MQAAFLFLLILFLIILGILISMLYVVRQQSVAIVERFGRYQKSQRVVFICVCHSVSIKYSSYSTTFASK